MKAQLLIVVIVIVAASLACTLPLRTETTPVTLPQAVTVTVCPFVENPGPPPADLVKRAQAAFAATGLAGDLKVTGEGEYTCSEFHLRSVSFEFSLDVSNLKDVGAMRPLAARVKEFPVKEVLAGNNLGDIKVRFRAGGEFCWWDDAQGCGPAMPLP